MLSFFRIGKTHIPHRKNTASAAAVRMPAPKSVLIPTVHHIGAPSVPAVAVGDKVYVGTLIAEAGGFVGAPIHSSVSGTVKKIEPYLLQNGKTASAILIESDGEMTPDPKIAPPLIKDYASLVDAVRASGLVGLGGAGFPTAVKLGVRDISSIEVLVINGAECEPYITADTRTMLDDTDYVKSGLEALLTLSGIPRAVIGIEANKPECVERLAKAFASDPRVEISVLPSTYPQGAEKVLIYNTTGKTVPEGKLPSDVGAIVLNVSTLAFIAKYIETGMPLVEKMLTVDGDAVAEPKNIIAPVGTPIQDILDFCHAEGFDKVFYGGPMMGIAVYDTSYPILKNTNAITAFTEKSSRLPRATACIHCGRCTASCPMGLNPTIYARSMKLDDKGERLQRLLDSKLSLCIECGSCSYVCPAKRPLVENNRLCKQFVRETEAELKEREENSK